jgi:hypothetical protein
MAAHGVAGGKGAGFLARQSVRQAQHESLHEVFKRRIKTQTVLPCAETAAMLFLALLASGQIIMRKLGGWQGLAQKPSDQIIDFPRAAVDSSRQRSSDSFPTQLVTAL